MKLSLLLVSLLVSGCTISTEPETTPETNYGHTSPKPAPIPPEDTTPPSNPQCHTESYWIDNCLVTETYCSGKRVRVDVMCTSDQAYLFPWQYIPDPPPPWVDHGSNSNRK